MGVIVNKEEQNDELSRRINADLRAKMEQSSHDEDREDPDFVEDADYVRELKKTSKYTWVFLILLVIAIVVVVLALMP